MQARLKVTSLKGIQTRTEDMNHYFLAQQFDHALQASAKIGSVIRFNNNSVFTRTSKANYT